MCSLRHTKVARERHPQANVILLYTYTAHEEQDEITLTVERVGGSKGAVAVSYDVLGGSAQAGSDYTLVSGTLPFAVGETRKTFVVPLLDDNHVEGDETTRLLLHSVTGEASLGTRHMAVVTIVDDEAQKAGVLQFREPTLTISEDDGQARVEVERIGGSSSTVRVAYTTIPGSARAGADYPTTSGTLTFADGETVQAFSVPITDDLEIEASEQFTLTLGNASGEAVLGTHRTATLTIEDNDAAADIFEPNDTCAAARMLSTNSTMHQVTFDQPGDQDWLTFDAVEGEHYRIIVEVPPHSPANVQMEWYEQCEGTPVEQQNHPFSPGVRFNFDAPAPAPFLMKLSNDPSSEAGAEVVYTIQVRRGSSETPPGALILVAGKFKDDEALQSNVHRVTNRVYRLFQSRGYEHEHITYLATDMTLDADDDGTPDVDDAASGVNLEEAITTWAAEYVGKGRPLTIYLVGHGTYDQMYLDKTKQEVVTPGQVDTWLSELEHQRPGTFTHVIIESAYSGSFIDLGETVSKVGRMVVSSTSDGGVAYDSQDGKIFSDYFTNALLQGLGFLGGFLIPMCIMA
ncbi:MAG: hypothetical protein HC884_08185 [Chloroflexaceae bacterium]|nr:hypothetical protein [Chloroflexaceae bacterium]